MGLSILTKSSSNCKIEQLQNCLSFIPRLLFFRSFFYYRYYFIKLYHIILQSQKLNHKEIQVIHLDQEVQVNIFYISIFPVHVILSNHFETMRLLGLWPSLILFGDHMTVIFSDDFFRRASEYPLF